MSGHNECCTAHSSHSVPAGETLENRVLYNKTIKKFANKVINRQHVHKQSESGESINFIEILASVYIHTQKYVTVLYSCCFVVAQ